MFFHFNPGETKLIEILTYRGDDLSPKDGNDKKPLILTTKGGTLDQLLM